MRTFASIPSWFPERNFRIRIISVSKWICKSRNAEVPEQARAVYEWWIKTIDAYSCYFRLTDHMFRIVGVIIPASSESRITFERDDLRFFLFFLRSRLVLLVFRHVSKQQRQSSQINLLGDSVIQNVVSIRSLCSFLSTFQRGKREER